MKPKGNEVRSGPTVRAWTTDLLHLSLLACLTLGLLLGAGCGQGNKESTAASSEVVGPTLGAHPLLQKWSSQPLAKVQIAATGGDASAQYYLGWAHLCGLSTTPDAAQALRWFRQAAEQGVPEAQVKTGLFHELGIGTPQDFTEALKWYGKAAEKGYAGAQVRLGMIYGSQANVPRVAVVLPGRTYSSRAVAPDYPASYKWFSLAAEQGYPAAQVEAARMLRIGMWTQAVSPLDHLKSRPPGVVPKLFSPKRDMVGFGKWLRVAADQGDPAAREELAKSAKQFDASASAEAKRQAEAFVAAHPPKDWTHVTEVLFHLNPTPLPPTAKASEERFSRLLDKANSGDTNAQYTLALCLHHDTYAWDPKAHSSHLVPRQNSGVGQEEDPAVPVRTKLAGQWYAAAAAQGHAPSTLNLALMYASGRLGEAQRHLALDWFRRASDRGQAEAQFQLAQIHKEGRGVPANYAEAVKWYRVAAAQGHTGASQALGLSVTNALAQQPAGQAPSKEPNSSGASVPASRPAAGKAIRLAIVPADPLLRAATDVLTAQLSQQPDLQLLERGEIDRVFGELALARSEERV